MTKRRMLAGLVAVAAGASAVTAGLLAGVGGAGQSQAGSDAVSRVERAFSFPWKRECSFDACVVGPLVTIPVTTPPDQALVDVTLTVTLDYATSRGDAALIAVWFSDDGTPKGLLPRSAYRFGPSQTFTSTTLTWQRRNLAAAGREYAFNVDVWPPFAAFVKGRQLTVVVETWSAGD